MSDITNEWKELRQRLGEFICRVDGMNISVDSKLKKLQEKEEQQVDLQAQIDEAYNKGIQDAQNALNYLANYSKIYVDLNKAFGTWYLPTIFQKYSIFEIIEITNQLKAEEDNKKQVKEQELHVGDEILVINNDPGLDNRTFVIYEIDDYHYYVIEPITFYKDGFYKDAYDRNQLKKTGKHYDSIPLSKEINSP